MPRTTSPSQYSENGRVRLDAEGRRILQCHSRGAQEYSPLFCPVRSFGLVRSIEDHYQGTKVFTFPDGSARQPGNWREAKEWQKTPGVVRQQFRLPNGLSLGNDNHRVEDLVIQYYISLWFRYLKERPVLIERARGYDGYEDIFEGSFPFSQARVIEQCALHGLESLPPLFHPLRELLRTSS